MGTGNDRKKEKKKKRRQCLESIPHNPFLKTRGRGGGVERTDIFATPTTLNDTIEKNKQFKLLDQFTQILA